ncbi:hypothetical protein Lal_00046018 [Lupinus albus]|nr:hypothetical protein Lal_00046018 [Lupinus albus]
MYGGLPKLRRGASKIHRPHQPYPRSQLGASTSRNVLQREVTAAATAPPLPEEKFTLFSMGMPPPYSMIVKLTPDIVDEIKRLEAQGGKARVKFDSNPCNPAGNVSPSFHFRMLDLFY